MSYGYVFIVMVSIWVSLSIHMCKSEDQHRSIERKLDTIIKALDEGDE